MNEKYDLFSIIPDNSRAGITVCLNQKEGDEPFEATVSFKKSGKNELELCEENTIVLTASGKLRLNIGKNSFIEIFGEKSNKLKDIDTDEVAGNVIRRNE